MSDKEKSGKIIRSLGLGIAAFLAAGAGMTTNAAAAEVEPLVQDETTNTDQNLETSPADVAKADYQESVAPSEIRDNAVENISDFAAAVNSGQENTEEVQQTAGDSAAFLEDSVNRAGVALEAAEEAAPGEVDKEPYEELVEQAGAAIAEYQNALNGGTTDEWSGDQNGDTEDEETGGTETTVVVEENKITVTVETENGSGNAEIEINDSEPVTTEDEETGVKTETSTREISITGEVNEETSLTYDDGAPEDVKNLVNKGEVPEVVEETENDNGTNTDDDIDGDTGDTATTVIEKTENTDGTVTYTFTNTETSNIPLEQDDLKTLLGLGEDQELTAVEGEENVYTYTIQGEDGKDIEVKVTVENRSTSSTQTQWTVTVHTEKQGVDNILIGTGELEEGTPSVEDALENAEKDSQKQTNEDGKVISAVVDNKDGTQTTYKFTYTPEQIGEGELTNKDLFELLGGEDNDAGIELRADGNLYDSEGHQLFFDTTGLTKESITVNTTTESTQEVKDAAIATARNNAVLNAVQAALGKGFALPDNVTPTINEDGTWTATFTDKNGKTYNFSGTVSNTDPSEGTVTATATAQDSYTVTETITMEPVTAAEDADANRVTANEDGSFTLTLGTGEDAKTINLVKSGNGYKNADDSTDATRYEISEIDSDALTGKVRTVLIEQGYAVTSIDLNTSTAVCTKDGHNVTVSFDVDRYQLTGIQTPDQTYQYNGTADTLIDGTLDAFVGKCAEGILEQLQKLEPGQSLSWDGENFYTLEKLGIEAGLKKDAIGDKLTEDQKNTIINYLKNAFSPTATEGESSESSLLDWLKQGTVINFEAMSQEELADWLTAQRNAAQVNDYMTLKEDTTDEWVMNVEWLNAAPQGWTPYYVDDEGVPHELQSKPLEYGEGYLYANWFYEDESGNKVRFTQTGIDGTRLDFTKQVVWKQTTGSPYWSDDNTTRLTITEDQVVSTYDEDINGKRRGTRLDMVLVYMAEDGSRYAVTREQTGGTWTFTYNNGTGDHVLSLSNQEHKTDLNRIQWVLPDYMANHYLDHMDLGFDSELVLGTDENGEAIKDKCVVLIDGLQLFLTSPNGLNGIVNGTGGWSSGVAGEQVATQDWNTNLLEYTMHRLAAGDGDDYSAFGGDTNAHVYDYHSDRYYKVVGTVAYGGYTGDGTEIISYTSKDEAQAAINALEESGVDVSKASITPIKKNDSGEVVYQVYLKQAELKVFGYLNESLNTCANMFLDNAKEANWMAGRDGYDLTLRNLTLFNGTVSAETPGAQTLNLSTLIRVGADSAPTMALTSTTTTYEGSDWAGTGSETYTYSTDSATADRFSGELSCQWVDKAVDEDVPLSDPPQEEFEDEDVPLSDVPQTGDDSGIWAALACLSGLGLGFLGLGSSIDNRKKRKSGQ